jgi:hypothetical protein
LHCFNLPTLTHTGAVSYGCKFSIESTQKVQVCLQISIDESNMIAKPPYANARVKLHTIAPSLPLLRGTKSSTQQPLPTSMF